ncbi:MAG: phage holin family protein [Acidimicrobiia bacterium]
MVDVDTTRADRRPAAGRSDWPDQTADTVVNVVGAVRDRTTGPILTVARGVVYGLFAAIVGTAALVVFVIGAVRAINNYLPDDVFGDEHTWAAHLIVGLVLVIVGGVLFARRGRAVEHSSASRR